METKSQQTIPQTGIILHKDSDLKVTPKIIEQAIELRLSPKGLVKQLKELRRTGIELTEDDIQDLAYITKPFKKSTPYALKLLKSGESIEQIGNLYNIREDIKLRTGEMVSLKLLRKFRNAFGDTDMDESEFRDMIDKVIDAIPDILPDYIRLGRVGITMTEILKLKRMSQGEITQIETAIDYLKGEMEIPIDGYLEEVEKE
jgi:hypothetical protein